MKRILCILSALTAGGAETFLMKVSRALPPEEYQIDFIVSESGGCYEQEVLDRGGRIHTIPLRTKDPIRAFRGIYRVVQDNGYQAVLKLGESSIAVVDMIAAKMAGAKTLALRSCNAPTGMSPASRTVHKLLIPVLNSVVNVKLAPSMLAAEYMFGTKRAHQDVHLLHNGVDLRIFRYEEQGEKEIRKEFSLGDRLVVGHVGRFHSQKNHSFLLKVFAAIRQKRPDAVLLLVGTGELDSLIRDEVRELRLQDAVVFAGQRFDIPQLLSAMDVFVFPSFYEGMPNTVIEAQATGLPCIIADTITREANITGLVQYLSLEQSAGDWAEAALTASTQDRQNTVSDFLKHGYDIQGVARELIQLLRVE